MFVLPMTRQAQAFSRQLERLFDDDLYGRPSAAAPAAAAEPLASRSPLLDIVETARGYTVQAELPGVAKDDVKVHVEGRQVSLSAQPRAAQERREGERPLHRERPASGFARSFTLPAELDAAACEARLSDGVLTLELVRRHADGPSTLPVR